MLKDVNDSLEHAKQLVELIKPTYAYVNLIPYNPVDEHGYQRAESSKVKAFMDYCIKIGKLPNNMNQEDKQIATFDIANNSLYKSSFKQSFIFGVFRPAIYALYVLTIVIVLYVGSMKILNSNYALSFSMIIIFYQYIERFYNPIQQLADQFNSLQSALAAGERISLLPDGGAGGDAFSAEDPDTGDRTGGAEGTVHRCPSRQ